MQLNVNFLQRINGLFLQDINIYLNIKRFYQ